MAFSTRVVASSVAVLAVIGVVAACDDPHDSARNCDYVDTQCHNVCDYYCDYYSCYPTCWDECFDRCAVDPVPTRVIVDGGPPASDAAPQPASDGGTGTGVLCTPCASNSECESGALCILRGGAPRDSGATTGPVGRGFCGHSCTSSDDCPTGFLCSQIGSSRQCLPTAGNCE